MEVKTPKAEMTIREQKIKFSALAALIVTALLIVSPIRSLLADCYYRRAVALIEVSPHADKDDGAITGLTMPKYLKAINSLETASALAPSNSIYPKALSELYLRLGLWAGAMEAMNAPLPAGSLSSKEAYEQARTSLNAAVTLEPSNPDYHYALGCLHDLMDINSGLSEKELARAVAAYPVNAPIRYAVAMEHVKSGRIGDALEQARALAKIADNEFYLLRAFEIAWKTTNDPEVVKGIAPDTPEAEELADRFLRTKRINETLLRTRERK
jgi:tetratricopeptide (TPR) repeat protein